MDNYSIIDEDWKILTSYFPQSWSEQAYQCGAMTRLRGFGSEQALLRTLLLHVARGYSLRETVVRAKASGIAEVSDVALLKRLRQAETWLCWLCQALLSDNGIEIPVGKEHLQLRVVDSTLVKEPGKTGSQWRIHYSLRIPSLACDFFHLTPTEGPGTGEGFTQFPVAAEDFLMGDRGYCSAPGIEYLAESGAYVLVRVNTGALPIYSKPKHTFPLQQQLGRLSEAGEIGQWKVSIEGNHSWIEGRLCGIRKTQQAIEQAHRRMKRRANRSGIRLRPETLEYAKYVLVFTTFPEKQFPAKELLDWYRFRWQIELVFKRLKTLAQLGHLPKYDQRSSRAWLYGKLFAALLTQKLVRVGRDISPWGYSL